MDTIGDFEAKVPVAPAAHEAKRAEAIERLKAFAERHRLGGLDRIEPRDAGRR